MIYWKSRTGNVKSVVGKIDNIKTEEITENTIAKEPFVLITYTDGLGEAPVEVMEFLQENSSLLKGVIASGNSNFKHFGEHAFAGAADIISHKYHVPILHKVDLRGYDSDIQKIQQEYHKVMEDF